MNQNTNVNLIPRFPFSGNLYFSQYDVGRVATINLVEDGTAYTVPTGATVKIQATKPSGLGFSVDCTYSGSTVTVVSTAEMTDESGQFPCEMKITNGTVILGTANFTFSVERSPHPDGTTDGTAESVVSEITVALQNALADVQAKGDEVIASIPSDYTDLSENVDAITEKMVLIESSANKWNSADKTNGYVSPNGNRNTTSTTYQTLNNPIPVTAGDIVRFYGNNFGSVNARFICAYDTNGNAVSASGSSSDTRTYTVPVGIASIIPSFLASIQNVMVTINEEVTEYEPFESPYYIATEEFLPESIASALRTVVTIETTDTETEVIGKMVQAYNAGNCDVVFERGVYNFTTAITTIKADYNLSTYNEIPIGNGCRYYFNGSTLNAIIDLATLGVDFYCNLLGTQGTPSDFELHDGILKATDTRYVVHDEAGGKAGTYKHLYQNMQLIYTTNLRTETIRKCVGGGTGQSGVIEMIGCKFVTDGTDSAVSFHGNATDYAGSEFMLSVRDCWISNSLRAGALSTSQTAKLFYANNSSGANLQTYTGWDVTSFLNEVR